MAYVHKGCISNLKGSFVQCSDSMGQWKLKLNTTVTEHSEVGMVSKEWLYLRLNHRGREEKSGWTFRNARLSPLAVFKKKFWKQICVVPKIRMMKLFCIKNLRYFIIF